MLENSKKNTLLEKTAIANVSAFKSASL